MSACSIIGDLTRMRIVAVAVALAATAAADVVINEVCYGNDRQDDGNGAKESDWVELYNTGTSPVDIGGYSIGKKKTYVNCEGKVCVLPSYSLDPGEFFVVFFDKDLPSAMTNVEMLVNGRTKSVPWIRSNAFSLGKQTDDDGVEIQDDVRLFDKTHERVSNYKGDELAELISGEDKTLPKNASYGYLWDGNINADGEKSAEGKVVLANATPWASNASGFVFSAPTLSVPPGVYAANQTVKLTSTDALATTLYYTLDGSDPRTSSTRWVLSNGGTVTVTARANATASSGAHQTNAWIRTSPVELGARVPNAGWAPPSESVPRASPLRVVAAYGPAYSAEGGGTYFIGSAFTSRTLPIISLRADEADLFSDARGVYVPGAPYRTSGYGGNKWGKPNANYYHEDYYPGSDPLESRAFFELLEPSAASPALAFSFGLALHGGGTRALPQKAIYCCLRNTEYGTKDITYNLMPALGEKTFKRFILRADGNDWYGPYTDGVSTMMKDGIFQRVIAGFGMGTMSYRPAIVYINGDYWGIHNIRESVDKHYFATRYGLDADNIDLLTHEEDGNNIKITRLDGDKQADEDYETLLQTVNGLDISTAAGYTAVTNLIDAENYTDYIVAETFFANTDWPANNCDFWRAHVAESGKPCGDGRWRWVLYDLDLAGLAVGGEGGINRNMFTYLSQNSMKDIDEPAFLLNRLWLNAGYRDFFIGRYTRLLNTALKPCRTAAIVRDGAAEIAGEIERHYRRWGRSFTQAQWSAAVDSALTDYMAQRWTNSFTHLNTKFTLGGAGDLAVKNADAAGVGGHFVVDGIVVEPGTDGVESRAAWTGRFFASRPVTVTAVPDAGYAFDGWVGSAEPGATRTVQVVAGATRTLVARFRPAGTAAYEPSGYERWLMANYAEEQIAGGDAATGPQAAGVSEGGRTFSNLALYAFGMGRADGLTPAQRLARMSLSIASAPALSLTYSRVAGGADLDWRLKASTSPAGGWRDAVLGTDILPGVTTNVSGDALWSLTVPVKTGADAQAKFFKLEAALK